MSREYALSRVKDALEQSGGNHLKAQRLLTQWLEKDQSLLFGLVSPHMHSIIVHALAHVDQAAPAQKTAEKKIMPKAHETSEFGTALLQSLSGHGEERGTFGEATPGGLTKPGKTSKAHVDAINKLVSAGRDKGNKTKK
jgi:hypothetical protein